MENQTMSEQVKFFQTDYEMQQQRQVPATQQTEKPLPKDLIQCPFCNCLFCSATDLRSHLNRFGYERQEHTVKMHDELKRRDYQYGDL
jgi:uncharacterized C2H2 Zn-finger protein